MLKKMILLVLLLAGILNAANLNLNKNTYNPNEKIKVHFSGMTAKNKDWLAIYRAGTSNEWKNVKDWSWTNDVTAGKITFKGLPAGNYEVRAFYNNSYHTEARKQFTVGGNNGGGAATVTTSKASYNHGETVTASFNHMSGNNKDWIAVYKAGTSNEWKNVVQWAWIGGKVQGSKSFRNLPNGNYEVRVFFRNTYHVEARHAFKVGGNNGGGATVTTNKASYKHGETVTASFNHMSGNNKDWIAVYREGTNNKWENVVQWAWTSGKKQGSKSFRNLSNGNYEVRVFFKNTYHVEARHAFKVTGRTRDVYIIQGQSNASALLGGEVKSNDRVKSFGTFSRNVNSVKTDLHWYKAQADRNKLKGFIGKWGMYMSSNIANSLNIPLVVLNGAVGGTRISQHLKDNANPENLKTIYGRLLYRANNAKIANKARVLFWYQGENDGSVHTSIATYKNRFRTLYNSWKNDYKNLEKIYIFQVRAGCGNPYLIMEAQREIANEYKDIEIMSTTGTNTQVLAGNCHYTLDGYKELANRMERLVKDDLYHIAQVEANPPEVETIHFTNNRKSVILKLKEAQNLHIVGNPKKDFIVENSNIKVTSIKILHKREIQLNFSATLEHNAKLTYFGHKGNENSWIQNSNKLGLITFYNMSITN